MRKKELYQCMSVGVIWKHRYRRQWRQPMTGHRTINRGNSTSQFVSKGRCFLRAVYSILQPLLIVQLRNPSRLKRNDNPMILKGKAYSRVATSQFSSNLSCTLRNKCRFQPYLILQSRKYKHTWPHHVTFWRRASCRITSSSTAAWLRPFFAARAMSKRLASGVKWKPWKMDLRCRSGVFMRSSIKHSAASYNAYFHRQEALD